MCYRSNAIWIPNRYQTGSCLVPDWYRKATRYPLAHTMNTLPHPSERGRPSPEVKGSRHPYIRLNFGGAVLNLDNLQIISVYGAPARFARRCRNQPLDPQNFPPPANFLAYDPKMMTRKSLGFQPLSQGATLCRTYRVCSSGGSFGVGLYFK